MNLTERQTDILRYIKSFIQEKGHPPTVREIGKGVQLLSTATVYRHMEGLKEKGMIEWEPKNSRTLKVRA